jgi:hypothetical protein
MMVAAGEAEAGSAGEQPARNSRLETHSDGPGAGRSPAGSWDLASPGTFLQSYRSRFPHPSKTHASSGTIIASVARRHCELRERDRKSVTQQRGGPVNLRRTRG